MDKNKMYLKDIVANKILKDVSCREYLVSIIAVVLKLDKEYVMNNLRLIDTKVSLNIEKKDQEVDVAVENDFAIINLEVNYNYSKKTRRKNNSYIAQLLLRQTFPGFNYLNLKPVIQININNYDCYGKKEFIYHTIAMEEKFHIPRKENPTNIYDIDLDILQKIPYTEIEKLNEKDLRWLLYIFVCHDDEIRKEVYQENHMMEKVEKKMKELFDNFDQILYYNHDEFNLEAAREEREEKAFERGTKQKAIEIAKVLLTMPNITIKQIAEATKLSEKEIKEIN